MTDEIVDFKAARERLDPVRKERAEKALRKQFHSAMGWKNRPKPKASGSKGPKPGRGKKKR